MGYIASTSSAASPARTSILSIALPPMSGNCCGEHSTRRNGERIAVSPGLFLDRRILRISACQSRSSASRNRGLGLRSSFAGKSLRLVATPCPVAEPEEAEDQKQDKRQNRHRTQRRGRTTGVVDTSQDRHGDGYRYISDATHDTQEQSTSGGKPLSGHAQHRRPEVANTDGENRGRAEGGDSRIGHAQEQQSHQRGAGGT